MAKAAKAEAGAAIAPPLPDLFRTSSIEVIARTDLIPWPGLNPRTHFSEAEIEELAESMRTKGWAPNSHLGVKLNEQAPHWVYAGERRLRAAERAGVELIPCVVQTITEEEAFLGAFLENLGREELTPVEEARGIQRYMGIHGDLKQADVGKQLAGKGQSWVSNRLRLLKLPPVALALIEDGIVSASAARDDLVPVTNVSADYVGPIFEAICAALVTKAKGEKEMPINDNRVGDIVREQLMHLSGPIRTASVPSTVHIQLPGGQSKWGPCYVTEAAHAKKCDCGTIMVARYSNGSKEPRCVNLGAWRDLQNAGASKAKAKDAANKPVSPSKAEQQKAAEAADRRERKKIEKVVEGTTQGEPIPAKKAPPHMVIGHFLPSGELAVIREGYALGWLDQSRIQVLEDGPQKKLVCFGLTEDFEAAANAGEEAVESRLASWRAEKLQHDLEQVGDKPIGSKELAILFSLLAIEDEPGIEPGDIQEALRSIGLLPAEKEKSGYHGGYVGDELLDEAAQQELGLKSVDDVTAGQANRLLFHHLVKATAGELRLALGLLVHRLEPCVGQDDVYKVKQSLGKGDRAIRETIEAEYCEQEVLALTQKLPFLAGVKVTMLDADAFDATENTDDEDDDDGEGAGGEGSDTASSTEAAEEAEPEGSEGDGGAEGA